MPRARSAVRNVRSVPGWRLVWSDDFDGSNGSPPDPTKWVAEDVNSCNGGTIQGSFASDDAYLDGNSNLVLRAQSRASGGCGPNHYTSGQVSTQGLFSQAYGKFEARILLPAGGDGIWPAWWMYPINGPDWPTGGELDILEMVSDMTRADMTYHWDSGGHQSSYESYTNAALAVGYHVYGVEWEANAIRWYIDGVQRRTEFTGANVVSNAMNLLLGLQLGNYFSDPISPTLPQYMLVDWVRVYQWAN